MGRYLVLALSNCVVAPASSARLRQPHKAPDSLPHFAFQSPTKHAQRGHTLCGHDAATDMGFDRAPQTTIGELSAEFIVKGSAKDLDTSCVERFRRPPFATELPVRYTRFGM